MCLCGLAVTTLWNLKRYQRLSIDAFMVMVFNLSKENYQLSMTNLTLKSTEIKHCMDTIFFLLMIKNHLGVEIVLKWLRNTFSLKCGCINMIYDMVVLNVCCINCQERLYIR